MARRLTRSIHNLPIGEAHHSAKLTATTVRELRRLHYDVGICCQCAAKLLNVNRQTAYDAINFYTWKHVL